MAKLRILWDNEWDGGTVDALTEATDFPAENTQHIWRKRVYRSTAVAAQYLRCDLGATPPAINTLIIENHNIPAGATLQLIGSDNADTTGNTVTINLTITADRIVYETAIDYTRRWWRISMDGGGGAYFEVGRIFLGDYFEFTWQYAKVMAAFVDPSQTVMSDGGQVASNQQDRFKAFTFAWSPGAVSEAEYQDLYDIFGVVGIAVPYWIVRNADATDIGAHYVLNQIGWTFDQATFECYGFSLAVEEAR